MAPAVVSSSRSDSRLLLAMIDIVYNGEPRQIDETTTISELLRQSGVAERLCAVELNESVLPKPLYALTQLQGGDKVEVVTFVGGG